MWKILVIMTLTALAACSTQGAVRVRCDRHLVPINVPVPTDPHSGRRSSSPPARGEHR